MATTRAASEGARRATWLETVGDAMGEGVSSIVELEGEGEGEGEEVTD